MDLTRSTVYKNIFINKDSERLFPFGFLILMIMIEVFTGGGGDFYSFSVSGVRLTLRILLFALLILFYVLFATKRRIYIDSLSKCVYALVFYNFVSMLFGAFFNDSRSSLTSFLSSLYLVAFIPFMSCYKQKTSSFKVLYFVLLSCSTVIATVTLGIYFACNSGLTNVYEMRRFLGSINGDWWMRANGSVAYPSQTYVMIACLFILAKTFFRKTNFVEKILMFYFALAVLSTCTRGLIITMIICSFALFLLSIFMKVNRVKNILFVALVALAFLAILPLFDLSRVLSFSDQVGGRRLVFLSEGLEKNLSNPFYLVFGMGFGASLPSTGSLNLEISLFEIFIEQGLIGLSLWIIYFALTLKYIVLKIRNGLCPFYIGIGLVAAVFAIFIESFTNPYINNTVGIICFFLCLLICKHESFRNQSLRGFNRG